MCDRSQEPIYPTPKRTGGGKQRGRQVGKTYHKKKGDLKQAALPYF